MRLAITASGIAAVLALSACGGGGSTTIIEKTVTSASGSSQASATFLPFPYKQGVVVEPRIYSFVEDGSLLGRGLNWEHWGSPSAKAIGTIEERNWASSDPNAKRAYAGSVVASGLERCEGRSYYTEVIAQVPAHAVYVPEEASQLATPCRSYESIQKESEPAPQAQGKSPSPASHYVFFETPSGNIACGMSTEGVRCDISEKEWEAPPRPATCHADWGVGLELPSEGPAMVTCASDSVFGSNVTLPYGKSRTTGTFTCVSLKSKVVCRNRGTNHGFELSRQSARWF